MMTKAEAILGAIHWLMDPHAKTKENPEGHARSLMDWEVLVGASSEGLLKDARKAQEYFKSKEGQAVIEELHFGAEVLSRMLLFKGPGEKNLGLDLTMTLADLEELGIKLSLRKGVYKDADTD